MGFEVADNAFGRPLVRFSGENNDGFPSEENSKSGRFVSLAGEGDEVNDSSFFRLRELYVR